MNRVRHAAGTALLGVSGALLVAFFAVTLLALATSAPPGALLRAMADPAVGAALRVSVLTSSASLTVVVLLGTPLGWWLGRRRDRSARWIEVALQLPEAVPPAVAGLGLLLAFGRQGLVGRWLGEVGVSLAFTPAAVIFAQVFVAAPFFVQAAVLAFRGIDEGLMGVARSLGAGPTKTFVRIVLPLGAPGLLTGLGLAWARALGEFGATLMFAGNLEGRTQTLPLAVYTALESDVHTAQALGLVLLLVASVILVGLRMLARLALPSAGTP